MSKQERLSGPQLLLEYAKDELDTAGLYVAATLAAAAGKTTYISGLQVTEKNPTAAADITVTTTGLTTNQTWNMSLLATAATVLHPSPLIMMFEPPIPASGPNVAIVVTSGAAGTAGLASVNLQGYQL